MIEAICGCGWKWTRDESAAVSSIQCPSCEKKLSLACAELLPPGAGGGDFDAILEIVAGPQRVGERIFLGGIMEMTIGKLEGSHILLPGTLMSRQHCLLKRVDFGPSKWSIADNASRNGIFVGGRRIEFKELADGDLIRVGEYELRYGHVVDAHATLAKAPDDIPGPIRQLGRTIRVTKIRDAKPLVVVPGTGIPCPSCEQELPGNAKICVGCGIKIDTGRPLLISSGPDEDEVHSLAESVIVWLSWIIPVTIFPMPLASEAFGKHKPWAIRGIAAVTVVASLIFLFASFGSERPWDVPGKDLMLWPPGGAFGVQSDEFEDFMADQVGRPGHFHAYQLITHAFLHDYSSILGCAMHLGGNMVFLLVFGSRVNALLGNIATLILYPILAIGAAGAQLWLGHLGGPLIGASGAIMGLAGMYFILFPVHRVYCGMWLRIWVRFRTWMVMKVFTLRGFWVLLIYAAYDGLMVWLDVGGSTAHWAHLGGFSLGVAIALVLLLSRSFNCGGWDLLSVSLGKYAWGIIGRPARWNKALAAR